MLLNWIKSRYSFINKILKSYISLFLSLIKTKKKNVKKLIDNYKMGASLPKDLINAERTKLVTIEGIFLRKSFDFENFRRIEEDENWERVTIRIHQAKLECSHDDEIEIFPINCEFLIIDQNHRNKECVIGLMGEKKLWKLQAQNIREFLDFTTALIQSKIPSWSISPVCQICSRSFNIANRRHHCRNCGKNICKHCKIKANFEIEGFYKLQKVCKICASLINTQIGVIKEIHRNELIRGRKTRSVFLPCPNK